MKAKTGRKGKDRSSCCRQETAFTKRHEDEDWICEATHVRPHKRSPQLPLFGNPLATLLLLLLLLLLPSQLLG